MTVESRTVIVAFVACVCFVALFFLNARVRVDNRETSTKKNLRQIRSMTIPKPKYKGIIREQVVHVDKNEPRLRTEILYQGSVNLAPISLDNAKRVTRGIRDHALTEYELNHQKDMNFLHESNVEKYKDNEMKQIEKERSMDLGHRKILASMKKNQEQKTNALHRDIESAMESSSDSD